MVFRPDWHWAKQCHLRILHSSLNLLFLDFLFAFSDFGWSTQHLPTKNPTSDSFLIQIYWAEINWWKYALLHGSTKWCLNQQSGKYNCLTRIHWILFFQELNCPSLAFAHLLLLWTLIDSPRVDQRDRSSFRRSVSLPYSPPHFLTLYISPAHTLTQAFCHCEEEINEMWDSGDVLSPMELNVSLPSLINALRNPGADWSQSKRVRSLCRQTNTADLCVLRRGSAVKWSLIITAVTGRFDPL